MTRVLRVRFCIEPASTLRLRMTNLATSTSSSFCAQRSAVAESSGLGCAESDVGRKSAPALPASAGPCDYAQGDSTAIGLVKSSTPTGGELNLLLSFTTERGHNHAH